VTASAALIDLAAARPPAPDRVSRHPVTPFVLLFPPFAEFVGMAGTGSL